MCIFTAGDDVVDAPAPKNISIYYNVYIYYVLCTISNVCAYLRQVTTWWMRQHPKVLGLKFRPDVKRQAPTPRPPPHNTIYDPILPRPRPQVPPRREAPGARARVAAAAVLGDSEFEVDCAMWNMSIAPT